MGPTLEALAKLYTGKESVAELASLFDASADVTVTYRPGVPADEDVTARFTLVAVDGTPMAQVSDWDGDGVSNEDEVNKGTNPFDPASVPAEPAPEPAPEPEAPTDVYPPEVTVTPGGTTEIPAPALPDDATVTPAPSVPDWVDVKPDGNVIVTPPQDVTPGTYPVEVEITHPDKDPSNAVIDVTVEQPTDTAPAPSGSSELTDEERGRCIATGVGFGLPLLALIPIAIGSQVSLPWVDEFSQQAHSALQDFNTQLQQKTGLYNPDVAQQVDSINHQMQAFGREHGTLIGGVGAVAVAALVVTLLWKNCTPGEQLSSDSSSQK